MQRRGLDLIRQQGLGQIRLQHPELGHREIGHPEPPHQPATTQLIERPCNLFRIGARRGTMDEQQIQITALQASHRTLGRPHDVLSGIVVMLGLHPRQRLVGKQDAALADDAHLFTQRRLQRQPASEHLLGGEAPIAGSMVKDPDAQRQRLLDHPQESLIIQPPFMGSPVAMRQTRMGEEIGGHGVLLSLP